MRRWTLICAALWLSSTTACLPSPPVVAATGLALSSDHIYLAGPGPELTLFVVHDGEWVADGSLHGPCEITLDVELHADQLVVLCSDGSVFSSSVRTASVDANPTWTAHELPPAQPEQLQRTDASLSRIGIVTPPPPSDGSIRLHGPAPQASRDALLPRPATGPTDLWVGSLSWGPASANEAGDAFALPAQLSRHWQLSLMSTRHGNALCVVSERRFGWLRDVAVDQQGRRFAALAGSTFFVIDLGDAALDVDAIDLATATVRRTGWRCRR
ncbi:hypothetical protein DB30_02824 [Enhygromyxa salina]|uniref:Uncharacterized protein n=1 Tax=Enhygromyxa salina TaxID=215803 RepID=A0A0C2D3J8_9BACT|nr:hypothetical protein [Enhygromyxa salina]KIG17791.1 hypothetical protein DB30_02824 [Enhygromyxa salina]